MGTFFTPRFTIYTPATGTVIGSLNAAMNGKGSCTIRASKKGISIALDGKVLVRGKTPDDLHKAFLAELKKMNTEGESNHE